jgi:phospholipase C
MNGALSRREAIGAGLAAGAAWYGRGLDLGLGAGLQAALAAAPRCGRLRDIEHVVFFIQENRSFDHYFGCYPGVRGFGDRHARRLGDGSGLTVFAQPGYNKPGYGGHLFPFRLDVRRGGECIHDLDHTWGPQHRSWNHGRMDGFVREHLKDEGRNGTVTMGHYARADIPYYYALADAFTLCDAYHCSVIGGSDPNHAYSVSGMIDPAGRHGGPLVVNRSGFSPQLSWTTLPEQLRRRHISWKVYSSQSADNPRANPVTTDSPFPMFKQYFSNPYLNARGIKPRFPEDFDADVAAGELPQVCWVYADIMQSDHPPFSIRSGEHVADHILRTLASKPRLWAKTALFITWDENGAFFDHVPPHTPPRGTKGEYLTVRPLPSDAQGIAGPIGLGFRVPLLIVSPFTRGGFVCSERFDHTSLMRFVERRFDVEAPNLSRWRRGAVADLTGAFNFAGKPNPKLPKLPPAAAPKATPDCEAELFEKITGEHVAPVYPVPPNRMPRQEPGRPRRPSGC